ncbi:hypothetical protein ACIOKD_40530 [Streptomyces sp. NPDC087844]|uniref:hypothetical protein n=1 Tax=Streptomyces sp. NPDC087844 TaxID=3365805 RepID=UPI00381C4782
MTAASVHAQAIGIALLDKAAAATPTVRCQITVSQQCLRNRLHGAVRCRPVPSEVR